MKLANKSSLTMQHLAHEISTLFLYRKQQPKCFYISKAIISTGLLACSGFPSISSKPSSRSIPKLTLPWHAVEECQSCSLQVQDSSVSKEERKVNCRLKQYSFFSCIMSYKIMSNFWNNFHDNPLRFNG